MGEFDEFDEAFDDALIEGAINEARNAADVAPATVPKAVAPIKAAAPIKPESIVDKATSLLARLPSSEVSSAPIVLCCVGRPNAYI